MLLSASLQGPVLKLPVQPLCRRQSKLSWLELVQPQTSFWKLQGQPQLVSSELSVQSLLKSHFFFRSTQGGDPLRHLKHADEVGVGDGVGRPVKQDVIPTYHQVLKIRMGGGWVGWSTIAKHCKVGMFHHEIVD